MIRTRFDNPNTWTDITGHEWLIEDMSTCHLVNLITMFATKPERVMSILLHDVESLDYDDHVWNGNSVRDIKSLKESVRNVTSLKAEQLKAYAVGSPLGQRIVEVLHERGVNVNNVCEMANNRT